VRYPQEKRPDPLIQAIAAGDLTPEQRAALADLVQTVLLQAADGSVARPGVLMDLTIEDATRWNMIAAALRVNRPRLYPVTTS
jgi:hypothetical protein